MNTQCDVGGCMNGIFVLATAVRWSASLSTGIWLLVVFRRYETTVALPIEYGTATAIDVVSGLVFYQEYRHLNDWQLGMIICGCLACVLGVAVSTIGSRSSVSDTAAGTTTVKM